jgi:uroporphyrinogen-III decarboxylase
MTPRKRILTALRGGRPDRVPVVARMWKFLRKHYPDTRDGFEHALRAHEEFGNDVWHYAGHPPNPCFSPLGEPWRDDVRVNMKHTTEGGENRWERTIETPCGPLHDVKRSLILKAGSGSGPEIVEPLIKDLAADLPKMEYMMADPARTDINGAIDMDRRLGDRGVIVSNLMSPIDCRDMLKQADFLMLYYDDREAFREIVRIGGEACLAETRALLEGGMRTIKTWWFYASPSAGWSPKIYEEMFLPWLVRQVELVHSYRDAVYIYYDDGKMAQFLDLYVDAGIDALMTLTPPPMGDVVPEEVKRRFGDEVCLVGGFDAVNEIYLSDPERIRETVRDRLEVFRPGGGYIMDGSNSLVWETPAENVRAFLDAGIEFGGY